MLTSDSLIAYHYATCFLLFARFPRLTVRPPGVSNKSFLSYICRIYKHKFRIAIGLRFESQTRPLVPALYSVSVRQTKSLSMASFRSCLTADTLALELTIPLTGLAEDFHSLAVRPAGRTKQDVQHF